MVLVVDRVVTVATLERSNLGERAVVHAASNARADTVATMMRRILMLSQVILAACSDGRRAAGPPTTTSAFQ